MDPDFIYFLLTFVGVVIVFAIGLRLLLPIVLQHFKGSAAGWLRLSAAYATTRQRPAQVYSRQSVVVGQVLYRNCMIVGFDDTGLYLELGFPISLFGQAPIVHPLDRIQIDGRRPAVLAQGRRAFGRRTACRHHHRADAAVRHDPTGHRQDGKKAGWATGARSQGQRRHGRRVRRSAMIKRMAMAAMFISIACQSGRSEENRVPQPSELTSRGVIAEAATEAYKQAIESCYQGTPGDAPHGPQFLACLKQQLRSESETLTGRTTPRFQSSNRPPIRW